MLSKEKYDNGNFKDEYFCHTIVLLPDAALFAIVPVKCNAFSVDPQAGSNVAPGYRSQMLSFLIMPSKELSPFTSPPIYTWVK